MGWVAVLCALFFGYFQILSANRAVFLSVRFFGVGSRTRDAYRGDGDVLVAPRFLFLFEDLSHSMARVVVKLKPGVTGFLRSGVLLVFRNCTFFLFRMFRRAFFLPESGLVCCDESENVVLVSCFSSVLLLELLTVFTASKFCKIKLRTQPRAYFP